MSPLISLLVPVYNAANYLPAFVAALSRMDLTQCEVIFLIDGSSDDSEAVLRWQLCEKDCEGKEWHIIVSEENRGISISRQALLEAAKGRYVIYADPDDTMDADMLQTLLAITEQTQADMVWEDYFLQKDDGCLRVSQESSEEAESFLCQLLTGKVHGATWNKLFRKSFLEKHHVCFPQGRVNLCEDICFLVNFLAHRPKLAYSPTCHYRYRVVSSSATHRLSQASFESLARVRDYMVPYIQTGRERAAFALWQKGVRFTATFSSQVSSVFLKDFLPEFKGLNGLSTGRVMRILYWMAQYVSRPFSLVLYNVLNKMKSVLVK